MLVCVQFITFWENLPVPAIMTLRPTLFMRTGMTPLSPVPKYIRGFGKYLLNKLNLRELVLQTLTNTCAVLLMGDVGHLLHTCQLQY